ncbi:MAG: PTS sugar transporter subunit IIA [Enterococcus sp.]
MSKNLILISHGNFCNELKKSTEMIMGEQKNIYTVALLPEDSSEDFRKKFLLISDSLDDFVVLCDLLGGTPANVVAKLILEGKDLDVYTGMNLPMVIEFINANLLGDLPDFIHAGSTSILSLNQQIQALEEED